MSKSKNKPTLIKLAECEGEKIIASAPVTKTIQQKSKNGKTEAPAINYYTIGLSYNYGTDSKQILDTFFLELPPCISSGIMLNTQFGKSNYQMQLKFKGECQEVVCQKWEEIYQRILSILESKSAFCGNFLSNFEAKNPGNVLRRPLYIRTDPQTKKRVEGVAPSLYAKLYHRQYGTISEKTLFIDPQGKEIDWKCLYNVDVELIPVLQMSDLFVGGKLSIRFQMVSAIVLDLRPRNSSSRQVDTLEDLAQDETLVSKVSEQIQSLMKDRENFDPEEITAKGGKGGKSGKKERSGKKEKEDSDEDQEDEGKDDDEEESRPPERKSRSSGQKGSDLQKFLQSNPQMSSRSSKTRTPQYTNLLTKGGDDEEDPEDNNDDDENDDEVENLPKAPAGKMYHTTKSVSNRSPPPTKKGRK